MSAWRSLIRPITTLLLVVAFVYGFVVGSIEANVFAPTVAGVLGYWFGSRQPGKE